MQMEQSVAYARGMLSICMVLVHLFNIGRAPSFNPWQLHFEKISSIAELERSMSTIKEDSTGLDD